MSKRLTGLNPLAYMGVEPEMPPNMYMSPNAPTPTDVFNFNLGDFWVDTTTQQLWVLVSQARGVATWITLFGGASDKFITDSGTAIPAAGVINLNGDGLNINTTGSGSTIHVDLNPNLTLTGLTLTGFTGGVLVSNNSGVISEVSTTNHSLLIGNAAGTISSLGVATNGQLPIGSTGADPVLATITAGTGITVTNGAGSISIAASGSVPLTFNEDSGSATPSGGVITFHGGTGITTSGAGSTVTITATGSELTFDGNTGSATESGGIVNIVGTGGLSTSASGNTVTISGGSNFPQTSTIHLTNSQIKHLQATPIQIVAAQGANTIIVPISAISFLNYGGSNAFVAPAGASSISLYFSSSPAANTLLSPIDAATSYTQTTSNYVIISIPQSNIGTPTASCVNQPLYVAIDPGAGGEITGNAANDNTISIRLEYFVLTVPL
jgi:hypothetical protein